MLGLLRQSAITLQVNTRHHTANDTGTALLSHTITSIPSQPLRSIWLTKASKQTPTGSWLQTVDNHLFILRHALVARWNK
jgi:hypothetical protein